MSERQNVKVSIITISYNSEECIGQTIESVLGQTYAHIEYLIIDGASKDGAVKKAESYRADLEKRGIEYRVISEPDK